MLRSDEIDSAPAPVQALANADVSAFLNAILESSTDYSIVALNLAGTILAWNEGAHRIYGYTAAEVVGKENHRILSSPEDVESGHADAILTETLRVGRWVGRLPRARKDGKRFLAHVTLTLRRSSTGEALGFTMISKDLTEPERMTRELSESKEDNRELIRKLEDQNAEADRQTALLHESDEMFNRLTETGQQVFFLMSLDHKTVHYVSPSYENVWGRSCESLYQNPQSWMDAIHPDDRERVRTSLEKSHGGRLDFQYRMIGSDGATRWILARSEEIKDSAGNIKRLCGIALDVTDLKHAQMDVAKSEFKYKRLFDAAKDGIMILDADTRMIVEINPFLLQLLGFRAEECIGKELWDIGFSRDIEISKNLFEELKSTGYVRYEDLPLKTKAGLALQVEFVSNVYTVNDHSVIQCNVRDITKNKQLEAKLRQSQKMEGIGRLAGGIAHDFNNLLTGIMGYSEFLLEKIPETDPRRDDVLEILKSGERATALTRQLLAFSRQQVLTAHVLDVNAVVGELHKMLRRIIGENIILTFVPGLGLGHVKAGPGQLEQIIMNLCVNAKDAMANGGKLLVETANVDLEEDYVVTHPEIKAGPYVMLTICDTGCGMSSDVQTHLFEPFFTTKERGKGTGLGLSTVYGIVRQNGGSIEVWSEVGRGTMFKIYFPRCDEAILPEGESPAVPVSYRGSETVLLVEDDESVRKFVARVLSMTGYSVLLAKTPDEAIRICEDNKGAIQLMLTDVVMPGMLGYELSRRLESSMPGMKVIYMSGYTDQSIIHRAMMQGASFIQKPMTPELIARQVRQALDAPDRRTS